MAVVTVVGAGVIGLTVAVELTRAGHAVRVIAERVLDGTTSAVAGAVWFPYRVGPRERVVEWADAHPGPAARAGRARAGRRRRHARRLRMRRW